MSPVGVHAGKGPLVLGLPHTGTHVPDTIAAQLTPLGQLLTDTDWHVERLYDGLLPDVTTVRATFHRYVVDANRDPGGASLYPGQNTTGLVPLTDFDGQPLWHSPPTAEQIEARLTEFHAQYHKALAGEINRVRQLHGVAILLDCHSIRSVIPYLFDGTLPDFNLGTNEGTTCAPEIEERVAQICRDSSGFTTVVNGRFKGGWTTRHYGQPQQGVHAIQMELAQSTYLTSESVPFDYDIEKAQRLRNTLRSMLEALTEQARTLTSLT